MPQPNFLIFMPDQLRADHLGCFGHPSVQTPNIDALARRGVRFSNAYVNHPVCSPSRVALMTGWYPHVRGHRTLTHLVQAHEPNLLKYFKDAGYHVAWAGARGDMFAPGVTEASTHFSGWLTRPINSQRSMGSQYPAGSPLYSAFYHGKRPVVRPVERPGAHNWIDFDEAATCTAVEWLASKPKGPWLLFVPLIFPHLPFEVEEPWYSLHSPQQMPKPIPLAATQGKAKFVDAMHHRFRLNEISDDQWAEIRRVYCGMIARVDAQLGRILQGVDQNNETNNTNILFFTDHGEYLGDFGLVEKWPAGVDRCLTQNPLIFAGPDANQNTVAHGMVEMVDILPTLLEIAEIAPQHSHFGKSFTHLLKSPAAAHKTYVVCEGGFRKEDEPLFERATGAYQAKGELQHEQPELVGKAFALRDERWTYVYRLYESAELYDRNEDPGETTNLIDSADHQDQVRRLQNELLRWFADTSDVIPWQADPRFPQVPNGQHRPFP